MSRRVLALMAKQPVPGRVKTRLCPPLSPEQAAAGYESMLLDILDQHLWVPGHEVDRALWFAPAQAGDWFERAVPSAYRLLAQRGRDLGERMGAVFRAHAAEDYDAVVVRGSDSPTLPLERINGAFRALEKCDVVLCPDLDGGYNLIGLREPQDPLFELPMSTDNLLERTLALAAAHKLRCELLPAHYDVDCAADLKMLGSEVSEELTPRTRRWLASTQAALR